MAFKFGTMVDLYMAYYIYMLMLILMTLTFMQGHGGSGEEKSSVQLSQHLSKQ